MGRTRERSRRIQQGAALVEALMSLSMLVLMCGLITFLHHVYAASLRTGQEAREDAWARALRGCVENSADAVSLVDALRSGELPIPGSFGAGQDVTGRAQRSVSGPAGHQVNIAREVSLPCNTRLSEVGNAEAGQWVFDLFN
jgi:hypothetical protein